MAYVGTTNTLIANGGSADYLFVIKQSLISAGWTLLASSNGVTLNTGTPATDNLTTAAAFNAASAWCRLREPSGAGGREFILMHGAASSKDGLIKYSRSTGFNTTAAQNATTCPTTGVGGDGQLIAALNTTLTDLTATTSGSATAIVWTQAGYVQCVANNVAVNGVYGFWAFQYPAGGSAIGAACLFQEPIAPGSTPVGDTDPSARYFLASNGSAGATTVSIIGNVSTAVSNVTTYQGWSYWNAYGLGGAAYVRNRAANVYFAWNNTTASIAGISAPTVAAGSLSPYDGKVSMLPVLLGGASYNDIVLWKGFSSSLLTFSTTQNFADTFNLSSADPRIAVQVGPAGSCAIPWVTGVVPTV